jgi:predicted HTH domain antitoxin
MKTISIEVPDNLSGVVAESDDDLPRAVLLAAAIQWYSQGLISQGKGAELTGLTRAGFLDALFHAKVPACQVTPEELADELRLASKTDR